MQRTKFLAPIALIALAHVGAPLLNAAPVSMNLENGSEPRFAFSAIHDGGSAVNLGGVTWRTGVGSNSNQFVESPMSGTWDESTQVLTIDNNTVVMSGGSMDARTASVTLSSAGLDFSVGADQFIGTVEYSIDYGQDNSIEESGSFYFYNYNFPGSPNGAALNGETYEISLWGNNYDNVNEAEPALASIRGLDVRLTFDRPNSVPDAGASLASMTLLTIGIGAIGARRRENRQ